MRRATCRPTRGLRQPERRAHPGQPERPATTETPRESDARARPWRRRQWAAQRPPRNWRRTCPLPCRMPAMPADVGSPAPNPPAPDGKRNGRRDRPLPAAHRTNSCSTPYLTNVWPLPRQPKCQGSSARPRRNSPSVGRVVPVPATSNSRSPAARSQGYMTSWCLRSGAAATAGSMLSGRTLLISYCRRTKSRRKRSRGSMGAVRRYTTWQPR